MLKLGHNFFSPREVVPSNYTLSILCKLLGRARRLEQAFETVKTFTREYGFKANIQATKTQNWKGKAWLRAKGFNHREGHSV